MCLDNELDLSEVFLDLNDLSSHDRGRHHTHTETFKSCHCGDGITNSRQPKGMSKGKGSGKRDKKKTTKMKLETKTRTKTQTKIDNKGQGNEIQRSQYTGS